MKTIPQGFFGCIIRILFLSVYSLLNCLGLVFVVCGTVKTKIYIFSILIPLAVGGLASLLTSENMMLYDEIIMPPLAPPAILFPIVWSVLYVLMGIGSARILIYGKNMGSKTSDAFAVYVVQLIVNFAWSLIFFNFRAFLGAFIWLCFLWILIFVMLIRFSKVDKIAAYINIPYLIWVTFAGYLNLMIYVLN